MAMPQRYGIEKKINSIEGLRAYENGGKGSGNFGHAGRPGKVGGSSSGSIVGGNTGPSSEHEELKLALTSPKSNYGGDVIEQTKEIIGGKFLSGEDGLGEAVQMAYEDEARKKAGLPSKEDEQDGAGISYSDLQLLQGQGESIIASKTLTEIADDIGIDNLITALEVAQDMGARKYAQRMAEKADNPTEWGNHEALAKFAKDMELRETYGKLSEKGLKDAWRAAEAELNDRITDWEDNIH